MGSEMCIRDRWKDGGLTLPQLQAIEQAHAQAMLIQGYKLETVEVVSAEEAEVRRAAAEAEAEAAGEAGS